MEKFAPIRDHSFRQPVRPGLNPSPRPPSGPPSGPPPGPPSGQLPDPPPSPSPEHIFYRQVEPGSGESTIEDLEKNLPREYPSDPEFNNSDNNRRRQIGDTITNDSRENNNEESEDDEPYTDLTEEESNTLKANFNKFRH